MLKLSQSDPAAPTRVVIIGAGGFIGAALSHTLARETKVVGLGSKDVDLLSNDAATRLESQLATGDAVVFISALTPDRGRGLDTVIRNLRMTESVTKALAGKAISQLVYVSSDAVYDDATSLIRETSPCNPSTFHGAMHLTREIALRQAAQAGKFPLTLIRPTAVYGPGDTHGAYGPNRFLNTAAKEGRVALFGEGEERRDHLFIDDLCALTSRCLGHRTEGVINAVSGTAVSFREVAERAQAVLARPVTIVGSPRANPITHRHFDTSALRAAFPTLPITSLDEGLKRTLAAMKA